MKRILIPVFLFIFLLPSLIAQTDCNAYLPGSEGTVWEVTHYSKKGKETGKMVYELVSREVTDEGVTYRVRSTSYDKKGEETFNNTFEAYCRDGKFSFDMSFMMNGEGMAGAGNMEMEMDATEFYLPDMNAAPGTPLPDAALQVALGGDSPVTMNFNVEVTNREIHGQEEITTPAGTFQTLKLSQDVSTKMIIGVKASSIEWYAEDVGMVRSETYNKAGKLTGYSELTRLDRQ